MRTDISAAPARPAHLPAASTAHAAGAPVLDVVIPVYNEERTSNPACGGCTSTSSGTFPYAFRITIADNASTDRTPQVAARLADELPEVAAVRLEQKGRGRALRTVWSRVRRAGARLYGRRSVHRPQRAAAAGRPADLRALRPGDRLPAGPRRAGGARRRSGSSSPAPTT